MRNYLNQWGGEDALDLTPEEVKAILAGKEVLIATPGQKLANKDNNLAINVTAGAISPKSMVLGKEGRVSTATPGEPRNPWLKGALKKEGRWKKARRVLLQCQAELSGLDRNIQNAREIAIREVFPEDTYDPSDPRIERLEAKLILGWKVKRDALLGMKHRLEEQFNALEEKRVASLNPINLALWRACFGGLGIMEPEVIPEPVIVEIEKAGGLLWARDDSGSWVACSGSSELRSVCESWADEAHSALGQYGAVSGYYWTINDPSHIATMLGPSTELKEKLVGLGLSPIWTLETKLERAPEGARIQLVTWPFALEWSQRYGKNLDLLVEEWFKP